MSEYNGWTNYETWKVNLEILDGIDSDQFQGMDTDEVAEALETIVDEVISTNLLIATDYARSFVSEVNYHEIAGHIVEDMEEEGEEEGAE